MIDYVFYSSQYCLLCKEDKSETYICKSCKERIEYIDGQRELEGGICYYATFYNKFIQEKIKAFKYEQATYLARVFAEILYNYYNKLNLDIDYVTFVPMYRKDEFKRGYNQAQLMAKYFAKYAGIEMLEIFEKKHSTKNQNKLNKKERMTNLENSFIIIDGEKIKGKKILIIDDIVTTGTTLEVLIATLRKNVEGANVDCLALSSSKIEE